jgi:hypothetical protein
MWFIEKEEIGEEHLTVIKFFRFVFDLYKICKNGTSREMKRNSPFMRRHAGKCTYRR